MPVGGAGYRPINDRRKLLEYPLQAGIKGVKVQGTLSR